MGYKKLISPEWRVSTEKYELSAGIEVEYYSSREASADWGRVQLTSQLQSVIAYQDMELASIALGYDGEFDTLLTGFCRKTTDDYWKEIIIKDAMIQLERTSIQGTFLDCTPQDIVKYVLSQAGIEHYRLSENAYGKRERLVIAKGNGVQALKQINSGWRTDIRFFFREGIFYWGCKPDQKDVYVLEEGNNILSLQKKGELFEIETLGVPWIHHSEELEVAHAKYSGTVTVEKTIIKSNEQGFTRMYLYFRGE